MSEATVSGMRFKRIEIRNFGTWNGPAAHVFRMDGGGAVVTGENGAGKSTLLDAVQALFDPSATRFNAAALTSGEQKSSRDISSYYRGAYGNTEDEERGVRRDTVLRRYGDESMTMAILAVFENELGEVFSVARTVFFTESGTKKSRYFTGPVDMRVDAHLRGWPSKREQDGLAERHGFAHHEKAEEFWAAVTEGFGLRTPAEAKRAFRTLITAMAVPHMTSITRFVRDHLLPQQDLLSNSQELLTILENHGKVQDEIRTVKRRIESLTRVTSEMDALEAAMADYAQRAGEDGRLALAQAYVSFASLREGARDADAKRRAALTALGEVRNRMEASAEALEAIRADRARSGTADLGRLRNEARNAAQEREEREAAIARIVEKGRPLGITEIRDEAGWAAARKRAESAVSQDGEQARLNDAERERVRDEKRTIQAAVEAAEREVRSLSQSGTGVDSDLVRARDDLARRAGLGSESLPFFAELVQVKAEHAAVWETALNRLLRGVSTTILVPEGSFRAVKGHLPRLTGRSFVRLQEVWDDQMDVSSGQFVSRLPPDAAAWRLDVRADSPYGAYVEKVLSEQANHACVSDDEIGGMTKRAITPSGAMVSGADRAQRDMTQMRNVLGWDMSARLGLAKAEMAEAQRRLEALDERERQAAAGNQSLAIRVRAAEAVLSLTEVPWSVADPGRARAREAEILERLRVLTDSDEERALQERERAITEQRALDEQEQIRLHKSIGGYESTVSSLTGQRDEARADMAALREAGAVISAAQYRDIRLAVIAAAAERRARVRGVLISPFDGHIKEIFRNLRSGARQGLEAVRKGLDRQRSRTVNAVGDHLRVFEEDAGALSTSVADEDKRSREARASWRERLAVVQGSELQAVEAKAREFSRANLTEAITDLKAGVLGYDRSVRDLVRGINEAMSGHVYNPSSGSYASIHLSNSKDPYHQDLDRLLDEALADISTKTEADFYADVGAVADYLKDEDTTLQRNRRDALRNLANRYSAIVREKAAGEDGRLTTVRTHADSGALSGGEKERMNVFLLSAAVRTAFTSASRPDLSLRAFLMDEAFSKSTDETASAAIEIIRSFGLQIIVATPMTKLLPFEPVSETVFLVSRPGNRESRLEVMKMGDLLSPAADDARDG